MATTDFLDEKRREITDRLTQLKPLVDEYSRLKAAADVLEGVSAPSAGPNPARRAAARPSARTGGATHGRRGRPKGSGTRRVEALELVKAYPGITISEIAEKMGIRQNYLYRVLPGLAQDGLVIKDGRGWHPTDPTQTICTASSGSPASAKSSTLS
jgi:CRP-like cAMP-binding protein